MSLPLTVYFWEHQVPTFYNLTLAQVEMLKDTDQEMLNKFEAKIELLDEGYAPGWLFDLSERTETFEVGSI